MNFSHVNWQLINCVYSETPTLYWIDNYRPYKYPINGGGVLKFVGTFLINIKLGLRETKWNTIKTKPMREKLSEENTQFES